MHSPSISLQNVSVTIGRTTPIHDITFNTYPGRVFGLVGPNGAGKSTTFKAILGLLSPSGGTISPRSSQHIGATIDGPSLFPQLSATNNLLVHARLTGTDAATIPPLLEKVGLGSAGRKPARNFSMGMKVRLSLAQVLLTDPSIVILDEPQNGLDPEGIRELRRVIRSLAEAGKTVIISSHQLHEVESVADDIGVIAAGRTVFTGQLQQLHEHGDSLEDAYFRLTSGGA